VSGRLVGREAELVALDRLLTSARAGPAALLLEGEAGIGKTTVWEAGLALGRAREYQVLSCRPAEAEARLAYAALAEEDLVRAAGITFERVIQASTLEPA
jgi:AAA ATPase domain